MRLRRQNPQAAFTLVELMIGSALAATIMAAVLSTYIYLGRGLARLANQQTLETEARRTLAYFTQDVQSASGLTDTGNRFDEVTKKIVEVDSKLAELRIQFKELLRDVVITQPLPVK